MIREERDYFPESETEDCRTKVICNLFWLSTSYDTPVILRDWQELDAQRCLVLVPQLYHAHDDVWRKFTVRVDDSFRVSEF